MLLCLASCSNNSSNQQDELEDEIGSLADSIVHNAIQAHGGKNYENAHFSFDFRGMTYTFKIDGERFEYTRSQFIDDHNVLDVYSDAGLKRYVDDVEQELSEEDAQKYSESINSVIYFTILPYKLNDSAVNKEYLGNTTIKGKVYDVVKVTFDQHGGGTDYQDEYCYWFDIHNHYMDYLAYNFQENGGGARFRAAYNQREVGGIRFQDYVNYKADPEIPLENLAKLYEQDKLELLSMIANENVKNLDD